VGWSAAVVVDRHGAGACLRAASRRALLLSHTACFLGQMACLLAILALEIWPMVTLIRWRSLVEKGRAASHEQRPHARRIRAIQAVWLW